MKAQFRNAALVVAFCCIASIAFAEPPKTPRISLAGTFNNWNTSDPDYTLKQAGAKFELVRAWPCGTSEFKFVFDGSWSKHLGDAGGGKMTQPGGDIKLVIQQSATYAIVLDSKSSAWSLTRRGPARPRAVIQVVTAPGNEYMIDGRLSEAREGRKIQKYLWRVDRKGQKASAPIDHNASASWFQLSQQEPEPTTVTLVVSDGEESEPAQATISHNVEWLVEVAEYLKFPLSQLRAGVWGMVFDTKVDPVRMRVMRSDAPEQVVAETKMAEQLSNLHGPTLVRFDEHSRILSAVTSGVHRFQFRPDPSKLSGALVIERVDLVGDFNGWLVGASPMTLPMSEARVRVNFDNYDRILELPDGVHHYRFVINGAINVNDPNADPKLTDADGNSGVRIGPDPDKLGPVKPNDVIAAGLFHDPSNNAWFAPIAADAAAVTVRTLADDVQSVTMECGEARQVTSLKRVERRDGFDYWRGQVFAEAGNGNYWFVASDGTARTRLDATGAADASTAIKQAFRGPSDMHFKTPDWAKSVVWYQIFPERFRNGDTSNDPPGTVPWKHSWFKPYKGPSTGGGTIHEKGGFFNYIYDRRYGGDLQGVRDKLPYLRELGVTAIYFNPIFLAESLHKYDASDYRHIDDYFGVKDSLKKIKGETDDPKTWQWSETDKLFLDFLQEAHRQGFKVVLDGVFNHVGRDFWAFKDVMKNGEKSPYAGWFDIESFKPFHYKAWDKDDGSLPRLKHDEALGLATPVREHLFAVTRRWMDPNGDGNPSDGIDGWRLDVAADINVNFWRDWRALVKKTNPDAYIVAELWQESRVWLDGQSFDAVMNYPFAVRSQRFFVNNKKASKPSQFLKEIHEILGWYAPHVNHCLQNLYDSHDTDRLASMFLNPDLEYDQTNRPQDNGPKYNTGRPTAENYHRMKLAVTWQMMFLGSPMIYYGNEVGMFGADDPTDRKPMLWPDLLPYNDADERIESDVFEHHQRMIAIRNTYRALRLGSFESVYDDDKRGIVAFVRRLGGEAVLVVINNSDKARRVRLPTPWDGKGEVYRVDDPELAVIKAAGHSKDRATIGIKDDAKTPVVIEKGVLKGMTLAPRTAGVYVMVNKE